MSDGKAVCIRCGAFKAYVSDACAGCGFAPGTDEEAAKSFVLSESFTVGERTIGKSREELARISEQIRAGKPYRFGAEELRIHLEEYREFKKVTPGVLLLSLIKWVGLPVLALLGVWLLLRSK